MIRLDRLIDNDILTLDTQPSSRELVCDTVDISRILADGGDYEIILPSEKFSDVDDSWC